MWLIYFASGKRFKLLQNQGPSTLCYIDARYSEVKCTYNYGLVAVKGADDLPASEVVMTSFRSYSLKMQSQVSQILIHT